MEGRCPYCLAELSGAPAVRCARCFTPHHAPCFREHGRCTVFGCEGLETTRDLAAERAPGWELHPLLPPGPDAQPRFLSLTQEHTAGGARRRPSFRLELPDQAACGALLEGTLSAFVPRALHGHGLRLSVLALADEEELFAAEAVLLGHPGRSWLERLRSTPAAREPVLLSGGRTRLRFRLDPSPLLHRARVARHERLGAYHRLELRAELDSRALAWRSRPRRVVVTHSVARCAHRAKR
ncbi:MAG: hypothetical protein AB7N76_22720 [Planctomycetota bacterium]